MLDLAYHFSLFFAVLGIEPSMCQRNTLPLDYNSLNFPFKR